MRKKLLPLGILFGLLCIVTESWAWDSGAAFYARKSKNTPSGSGDVYIYRGGAVDKLNKPNSTDWKAVETGASADITLSEDDKGDGKIDDSHSALNMYFFAKPRTGYDFVGWYSNENETGLMTGSTDHYDQNGKKTRWNNNSDATPPGSGYWAEEGIYYLRYVQSVEKGKTAADLSAYAKFIVKARDIILGGTGFDEVTYTATGFAGSVGKSTQTLSGASGNIELALTYNSEKYTFEGWRWAEGGFTGGVKISDEQKFTYPLTTTYVANGMTSSNKVHIWPVVKRKIVPVAEVTHNAVTTPYESWDEAIAAAKATGVSGATITLYKDIADIVSSQEIDRDMTLDLNGHTFAGTANYLFNVTGTGTDFTICNGIVSEGQISFSTSSVQYSYAIGVQSGNKLILQSGKVYANNTKSDGSSRGIEIKSGASLEMTGGSVEAQSLQQAYAIINRGTATISGGDLYAHTTTAATAVAYLNNGTTTEISGGTFRAYAKTTTAYGIQQNVNNTMTITNATVRAEAVTKTAYSLACTNTNGVIVVNGGKYNAEAPSAVAATNVTNKAQITLQGGIYRTNTNIASCAASGYGCYELNRGETWNEGYRYEVLPASEARNFRVFADGASYYFTSFADVNTFINAGNFTFIEVYLIVPEYTIPAGNYTIPSVAAMVIPHKSDISGVILQPVTTDNTKSSPTLFRKLNLANDAHLTVLGDICVGGDLAGIQGAQITGRVTGPYGCIHLNENSSIQLGTSSTLYAWGYISGEGIIDAPSGATIWEAFQFDWRGGSHVSEVKNDVFPVNQYYIQNIEATLILHGGAVENLYTALYVPTFSRKVETSAMLIGNAGMFKLEAGATLTKRYDNTKDRQIFDIDGDATLQNVGLTLNAGITEVSIDSKDYELPLTNNMTINIHSGTSTIKYDVDVLADAIITIDAGATAKIMQNLFVYDKDDWAYNVPGGTNTTGYFAVGGDVTPVPYTVSPKGTRNTSTMQDGTIVVNGTLRVENSKGYLYTTSKGANICSDGGGQIVLVNGVGTKTSINQQVNSASKVASVPVGPAQLHNSNGTYTPTAGSAAGTTFYYCNGFWRKGGCPSTITYSPGTYGTGAAIPDGNKTFGVAFTLSSSTFTRDGYTQTGWSVNSDGSTKDYELGGSYTTDSDIELFPYWTAKTYSIIYRKGANGTGTVAAGSKTHGVNATLSSSTFTRDGYTQTGWSVNSDGSTKDYELGGSYTTDSDIELFPYWTAKTYSIIYSKGANGTGTVAAGSKTHGVNATLSSSTFTRDGYTQTGWSVNSDGSTKDYELGGSYTTDSDIELFPYWTAKTYSIIYSKGSNGTGTIEAGSKTHGVNATLSSSTFTREGYNQTGWSVNADGSTKDYELGGSYTTDSDIELFPYWTAKTYSIIYSKGANGTGTVAAGSKTHGVNATLSSSTFTREGYTQTGWSTTDGGAKTYNLGDTYTDNAAIELFPYWTINTYSITISATPEEYGTVSQSSISNVPHFATTSSNSNKLTINGTTITATPATATAQYTYTFDHWANVPATITSDVTNIEAVFTCITNKYTILFKDGNGSTLTNTPADNKWEYGTKPTYTGAMPTKTEDATNTYTFNGTWSDGTNTYATANLPTVTGDETYTAQFTANQKDIGDYLDIVDWSGNGDGQSLTLNMNGYTSNLEGHEIGWKIKIGSTEKKEGDRKQNRTLVFSGLTLTAGEQITITAYDAADNIESLHRYTVPHIYTSDTELNANTGFNAQSIVYVREGKLTLNLNTNLNTNLTVNKMIVCPGAELEVKTGTTLTCTDLVLRTEAFASAILTDNGTINATHVYYTRHVEDKINTYPFGLPFDADISNVKLSNGVALTHGKHYGLLEYNGASRAEQGKTNGSHSNWQMLTTTTTLTAGKGYQLASTSSYYYELYFPVDYSTRQTDGAEISVTAYGDESNSANNRGWNYIVSPYTHLFNCGEASPEEALKISVLNSDNKTFAQYVPTTIQPATPFFYQAEETGKLDFTSGSLRKLAPRRMGIYNPSNDVPTQWIELLFGNAADELDIINNADRANIYLHPTKFSAEYELGYDVTKLSTQGARPLLWVKTTAGDLAFAALPDTLAHSLPLTVSVPAEGAYTFALNDNNYTSRIDNLILLDALTGTETDLRRDTYTCLIEAGQTTARFFLNVKMKQQGVTTEVDDIDSKSSVDRPVKLFIDGYIYILMPDGRMYDAVGKRVK